MRSTTGDGKPSSPSIVRFLLTFGLFWSLITLTFDGFLIWGAYRQTCALDYPTTRGTVTKSEVKSHSDDEGTTYEACVSYAYVVGKKTYNCDRYRYGAGSSNDNSASEIVAAHPAGKEVTVHYNPADPADAVLLAGIEGSDVFLALFMTPFNLIMLGVWGVLARRFLRRRWPRLAGGVRLIDDNGRLRLRPPGLPPVGTAAVCAGLTAFGLVFFVLIFAGGFRPTFLVVQRAWAAVFAAAVIGYAAHRLLRLGGRSDVVIDEFRQLILLPSGRLRSEPVEIATGEIVDIELEPMGSIETPKGKSPWSFGPILVVARKNGSTHREKLFEGGLDEVSARSFIAWLRERLRIEAASA